MRFQCDKIYLIDSEWFKSKYKIALVKKFFIPCAGENFTDYILEFQNAIPVLYEHYVYSMIEYFIVRSQNLPEFKKTGFYYQFQFQKQDSIFIN